MVLLHGTHLPERWHNMDRGDILLFHSRGTFVDNWISYWTRPGDFVHCAIAIAEDQMVQATNTGINIAPVVPDKYVVTVNPYEQHPQLNQKYYEIAIQWAEECAKEKLSYGWWDIGFQVIKFTFPNAAPNPKDLHYDCSDLVAQVLLRAGYPMPLGYEKTYTDTPNDIARLFNLAPKRL